MPEGTIKIKTVRASGRDIGRLLYRATTGATRLHPNRISTEGRLTTAEVKAWEEAPRSTSVYILEDLVPITIIGRKLWEIIAGLGRTV